MKANEFVKKFGWNDARVCILNCACPEDRWFMRHGDLVSDQDFDDLKRLVESHELTEKFGGLDVCKKIMFQKRLRQPKATHVLQHHENKKLIQFFSTNQSKPNGSVKLDAIEQAITDVESCMEGGK